MIADGIADAMAQGDWLPNKIARDRPDAIASAAPAPLSCTCLRQQHDNRQMEFAAMPDQPDPDPSSSDRPSPETDTPDTIAALTDAVAAAAFRRLVRHLRHRHDAENIDLMGLAGFCRNCLADWIAEADGSLDREAARRLVYGMDFATWKTRYQGEATPEQLKRMQESVAKNAGSD